MTKNAVKPHTTIPRPAFWLGLAGLLPFLLTIVLIWAPSLIAGPLYDFEKDEMGRLGLAIQIHYSGLILTFLGAVHWGTLMRSDKASWRGYLWSIFPSVLIWVIISLFSLASMMLNNQTISGGLRPQFVLLPLLGMFFMCWFVDRRAVKSGIFPIWYGRLRNILSWPVIVCVASTILFLFQRGI